MKKEVIIAKAKEFANHGLINPYIPDVLSDGSNYAEDFLKKLSVAETDDKLLEKIQEIMH